jgi:ADP-ribose pyrophosphatase
MSYQDATEVDRWVQISSEVLTETSRLTLRKDLVHAPDGRDRDYVYVTKLPGVMVVPVLPSGDLVFVKQHRYVTDTVSLEFPGGASDHGELPVAAAARELAEETGLVTDDLHLLAEMQTANGWCNERISIFLGRVLVFDNSQAQSQEPGVVAIRMSLKTSLNALDRGQIKCATTALSLLCYARFVGQPQ